MNGIQYDETEARQSLAFCGGEGSAARRGGSPPIWAQFRRALIVDDDETMRRSLVRLLQRDGVAVHEAKTMAEGISLLDGEPELVITDVRLPDGTGGRLVELASQRRPVPIIVAISGLASAGEAFALARSGACLYLTKPFAQRELLEGISQLTRGARSRYAPAALHRDLGQRLIQFAQRFGIPEREMALVRLATAGVSRARCPDTLGITENTCKTLTRRLLQRCGARTLAQVPRLVLME
jgi:DNA-binding NarL/FixJ family response regulator